MRTSSWFEASCSESSNRSDSKKNHGIIQQNIIVLQLKTNQVCVQVVPILVNFISGFQKSLSNFRCRSISSSYSTIIFLKTTNISSAAAVSRSLTNTCKHSNEDIVCTIYGDERNRKFYYQITSSQSLNVTLYFLLTSVRCHEVYFRHWKWRGFRSACVWRRFICPYLYTEKTKYKQTKYTAFTIKSWKRWSPERHCKQYDDMTSQYSGNRSFRVVYLPSNWT